MRNDMIFTYRSAVGRVPRVVASRPREQVGERGEEEAQGPGYYHIVVEINVEGYQDYGVTYSWKQFKNITEYLSFLIY